MKQIQRSCVSPQLCNTCPVVAETASVVLGRDHVKEVRFRGAGKGVQSRETSGAGSGKSGRSSSS